MSFIYNLADTWNNVATNFTAILMNVTNTASGASSLLMDLQVSGSSQFNVGPTGNVTGAGNIRIASGSLTAVSANLQSGSLSFGFSPDVFLTEGAGGSAATPKLQFGQADAAAPIAQILQFQNVASGTANTSGVNATIIGSLSTGSGTSGDIIFQTGATGASSTAVNTATTALTIKGATQQCIFAGAVRINAAPTAMTHTVTNSSAADSNTNFGHVMAFNFNGTTYYVPCGSVQP